MNKMEYLDLQKNIYPERILGKQKASKRKFLQEEGLKNKLYQGVALNEQEVYQRDDTFELRFSGFVGGLVGAVISLIPMHSYFNFITSNPHSNDNLGFGLTCATITGLVLTGAIGGQNSR